MLCVRKLVITSVDMFQSLPSENQLVLGIIASSAAAFVAAEERRSSWANGELTIFCNCKDSAMLYTSLPTSIIAVSGVSMYYCNNNFTLVT